MSVAATERVVVGKLSLGGEDGQLSVLALPDNFAWLQHFSARHLVEFFAELLEALDRAQQTADWETLSLPSNKKSCPSA